MKNKELARKIKALRNQRGFSQEELADKTGLSLRTVQRIENGETEPRGDSLKRLAMAFQVTPDEIMDWTVQEDKGFLISLNLSALSYLSFPLLGILVPLIIWISKKDKIKNVNEIAKDILNFQITWNILLFFGFIAYVLSSVNILFFVVVMYFYNLTVIVISAFRINKDKHVFYAPKIRLIRS